MMDINTMFQTKNYEILKKKLDLDINNNADSLNHTMSNFIDLKAISLNKYISEMYKDLNIKYKESELKKMIREESNKLKEICLNHIRDRKDKISSFFNREIDVTKITDDYLDDYHSHIDNLTTSFDDEIEISLREEICTNFSNQIVKSYKMPEETSKEQLLEYINKSYCNNLIEKIESETNLRNTTLKNLSKEAFERFKSMNEKTVE